MQQCCKCVILWNYYFMQQNQTYKVKWDAISISSSLICAVHCVALPILFSSISFLGIEWLENPMVEATTIFVSMFIGGWAMYQGFKKHHQNLFILILFFIGLCCMIAPIFSKNDIPEMGYKLLGGFFLITAHIKNWIACKKCELCNTDKSSVA